MSRRLTIVLTALATTLVLGVIGALVVAFDDAPSLSVAPMASAETSGDGTEWADPWADFEARCRDLLDVAYGPTSEDLERMRVENDEISALLDEAGVAYERYVDEGGWEYLEPAEGDWEAFDRVLDDYWTGREQDGQDAAWVEEQREDNDALIALFEEAGVEYEVIDEGDGYRHVQPVDQEGWELMDQFWSDSWREDVREMAEAAGADVEAVLACHDEEQELMAVDMGFDPFPFHMDMRMASEQKAIIEDLLRAFDEAGIDYQRMDVPFVQWDREDEQAKKIVERVADEHGYGMDMGMDMGWGMSEEELVVEEMGSDDAG